MASHSTHVRLGDLSIDEAVNVRKTGRGAEPIFTGSIRKRGVLHDLLVRPDGQRFTITDGGKRYEALIWLRDNNGEARGIAVTDDYPVPTKVVMESDQDARETSLISNVARSEMHPVDRFRRFAELIEDGASPADIASTYGMPQREVDKALALGALHPKILDAWRSGELRAETAQAYTLATDQKVQAKVFDKIAKTGRPNSRHDIRSELKAEDQNIGHLLNFVGVGTYEARGGKVTALDLFEGHHVVSDVALVGELAGERLKAECDRLVAAGWGWAAPAADLPNNWTYSWQKINPKREPTADEAARVKQLSAIIDDDELDWKVTEPAEDELEKINDAIRARAFGAKQMAKSGCAVSISRAGELEVQYGLVKPDKAKLDGVVESDQFEERRKERVKKAKTTGASSSAALSNALVHRLSLQMTTAAVQAVKAHPTVALDITIASILANGEDYKAGVKLRHSGLGSHKAKGAYRTHYEAVSKLTPAKKLEVLAEALGLAFDFQCHSLDSFKAFRTIGLCDAFGKEMVEATRRAFDAADYFNSVAKPLCLAAITEAVNADEARKVAGKPKADIAKFAIANVPKTGWLPPELRTSHYDGPAGAGKAKAATKPKAKPVAKRKVA